MACIDIPLLCRVMDLSRWKLPGLIASLQELATEGQLQDRVSFLLLALTQVSGVLAGGVLSSQCSETGSAVGSG